MPKTVQRVVSAALALLVVLAGLPPGQAAHEGDDEVRIATLDSGIRETHRTFEDGQVVAWRDFVNSKTEPYDDRGHGTAVASMAAGTKPYHQTPSHSPGTPLIVGKVLSADNSVTWKDLAEAVTWSVAEGADVITLSVYSYVPRPAAGYTSSENQLFDALEHAIDHGVFVTILAGNGMLNACGPTASWLHPPAVSPGALIVGGAYDYGPPTTPCSSMEPEVTAPYFVDVADDDCDNCYTDGWGTSFSTPLVAGIGAQVVEEAHARGIQADPALVEDAIQMAAEDTPAPPTLEGYGFLGADAASQAKAELPDPQPDTPAEQANQRYVEEVQDLERETWYGFHR